MFNKAFLRPSKLLLFFCFFLISFSAISQKKDYYKAIYSNSIEGYNSFIKKHPKSKYVTSIKKKLETCEYENAIDKNSISLLKDFLNRYPKSKYKDTVNSVINSLELKQEWELTKKINRIEDYQIFIKEHPESEYAGYAEQKIQVIKLKDEMTLYQDSAEKLVGLLDKYSTIKQHPEYTKLEHLTKEKLWKSIQEMSSEEKLVMFLSHFHRSRESKTAWEMLESIQSDEVKFLLKSEEVLFSNSPHTYTGSITSVIYLVSENEESCLVYKDVDYEFKAMDINGKIHPYPNGFSLPAIKNLPPRSLSVLCLSRHDLCSDDVALKTLNSLLHFYTKSIDVDTGFALNIVFKSNVENKGIVEAVLYDHYDTEEIKRVLTNNESSRLDIYYAIKTIKPDNVNSLVNNLTPFFYYEDDSIKDIAYNTYLKFDLDPKEVLLPLLSLTSGINDILLGLDLVSKYKLSSYEKQIEALTSHPDKKVYRQAYTTYFKQGYKKDGILSPILTADADVKDILFGLNLISEYNLSNYEKQMEALTLHPEKVVHQSAYTTYLKQGYKKDGILSPILTADADIEDILFGLNLISEYKLPNYEKQIEALTLHPDKVVYQLAYTTYFKQGYKKRGVLSPILSSDKERRDILFGLSFIQKYKLPGYEEQLAKLIFNDNDEVRNDAVFCLAIENTPRSIAILNSAKDKIKMELIRVYDSPGIYSNVKPILQSYDKEITTPIMDYISDPYWSEIIYNYFQFNIETAGHLRLIKIIANFGTNIVEDMIFYITRKDNNYTLVALDILKRVKDKKASPYIYPLMLSSDEEVQKAAILCYSTIKDKACINNLKVIADSVNDDDLLDAVFKAASFQNNRLVIPVLKHYLQHWEHGKVALEKLRSKYNWKPYSSQDRVYVEVVNRNKQWLLKNWQLTNKVLSKDLYNEQDFIFENAIFTYFGLGKKDVINKLARSLHERGDSKMATRYLNCGLPQLVSAAKKWAKEHGYEIIETYESVPVLEWNSF